MNTSQAWFIIFQYIVPIALFFVFAYTVHRLSGPMTKRLRPLGEFSRRHSSRRSEREETVRVLIANGISVMAFVVAALLSLGRFVDTNTIVWVVGLFSAAFGLGLRAFISDYATGLSFIFEDTFDVGDKVQFPMSPQSVEGVVEAVTLRATRVRARDGELYTMPNGEIRVVRNFSRGSHSATTVTVHVPATELTAALDQLEALGEEALMLLPNLLEPWQVISKSGELGEQAELTIVAKGRFGKGAELRTRMLALIQERLASARVRGDESQSQPQNDME
jgi:small conductance mechanosensitive channel